MVSNGGGKKHGGTTTTGRVEGVGKVFAVRSKISYLSLDDVPPPPPPHPTDNSKYKDSKRISLPAVSERNTIEIFSGVMHSNIIVIIIIFPYKLLTSSARKCG